MGNELKFGDKVYKSGSFWIYIGDVIHRPRGRWSLWIRDDGKSWCHGKSSPTKINFSLYSGGQILNAKAKHGGHYDWFKDMAFPIIEDAWQILFNDPSISPNSV